MLNPALTTSTKESAVTHSPEPPEGYTGEDRRTHQSWHVGKEIPLAVLLAIIVQTGGGIWWFAQVSAKMDYAIDTLRQFQQERYTREDARRDRELLLSQIDVLKTRDMEHERRLASLETAHPEWRMQR